MGQRLNIEIKENNEVLANAYYHWSAYTSSSLELTKIILDNISKINYKNKIVNAVKLLELTGAGLTENEMSFAKKYIEEFESYNFKTAIDRNEGLIAISPHEICYTERCEEHRVEINLDANTVNFDVLWRWKKDEYIEDYDNFDEDPKYNSLPIIHNIDFKNISFDKFNEVKEFVDGLYKDDVYRYKIFEDGDVYGFIE